MRVLRARLYQSMMGKDNEQRHLARKQQVSEVMWFHLSGDTKWLRLYQDKAGASCDPSLSDHRWALAPSQTGFVPTTSARTESQTTELDTLPETLRCMKQHKVLGVNLPL